MGKCLQNTCHCSLLYDQTNMFLPVPKLQPVSGLSCRHVHSCCQWILTVRWRHTGYRVGEMILFLPSGERLLLVTAFRGAYKVFTAYCIKQNNVTTFIVIAVRSVAQRNSLHTFTLTIWWIKEIDLLRSLILPLHNRCDAATCWASTHPEWIDCCQPLRPPHRCVRVAIPWGMQVIITHHTQDLPGCDARLHCRL